MHFLKEVLKHELTLVQNRIVMTREEIEKNRQYQLTGAAIDYCRKEFPHYDGEALGEITDAFEAGAEWADKHPNTDTIKRIFEFALSNTNFLVADNLDSIDWDKLVKQAMRE